MSYLAAATNDDFLGMAKRACKTDVVKLDELSNIMINIRGMYSAINEENGEDKAPVCARFKDFTQWLDKPIYTAPELVLAFSAILCAADMVKSYGIEDSNVIATLTYMFETARTRVKNYIDSDATHIEPVFHLVKYIENVQEEAGDLLWIPNATDEDSACEKLITWLLSEYPETLKTFLQVFAISNHSLEGTDMDEVYKTLMNVCYLNNVVVLEKPIEFEL